MEAHDSFYMRSTCASKDLRLTNSFAPNGEKVLLSFTETRPTLLRVHGRLAHAVDGAFKRFTGRGCLARSVANVSNLFEEWASCKQCLRIRLKPADFTRRCESRARLPLSQCGCLLSCLLYTSAAWHACPAPTTCRRVPSRRWSASAPRRVLAVMVRTWGIGVPRCASASAAQVQQWPCFR